MRLKVKIRKTGKFKGQVRGNAKQIDGNSYNFSHGWEIEEGDHSLYLGETAMIPHDNDYPMSAPHWIASGDLIN